MSYHHFQRGHNNQVRKHGKADIHQKRVGRQQRPQQIQNVVDRHIGKNLILNIAFGKADKGDHQHGDDADDFQNQQVGIQSRRRIDREKADQSVNAA